MAHEQLLILIASILNSLGSLILVQARDTRRDMKEETVHLRENIKELRGGTGEVQNRMCRIEERMGLCRYSRMATMTAGEIHWASSGGINFASNRAWHPLPDAALPITISPPLDRTVEQGPYAF